MKLEKPIIKPVMSLPAGSAIGKSREELAELIIDASDSIVCMLDLTKGKRVFYNHTFPKMLGWSEEMADLPLEDFYTCVASEDSAKLILQTLEDLKSDPPIARRRLHAEFLTENGQVVELQHEFLEVDRAPPGELRYVREIIRYDVQSNVLKKALQDSEAQLRIATQNSGISIWSWHFDSEMLTMDECGTKMLGYSLEEFGTEGSVWSSRVHPDDYKSVIESFEKCADGRIPDFNIKYRLRHRDGSYLWVHDRGKIVETASNGRPILAMGTRMNITAEMEQQRVMREELSLRRALLAALPDEIYRFDAEGNYIPVLNSKIHLMGGNKEAKSVWEAFDSSTAEEAVAAIRHCLCSGNLTTFSYGVDGRFFECRLVPFNEQQVLAVVRETTAQRSLEDQYSQNLMKLGELNLVLEVQKAELEAANNRLESLARTDGLTGLMNHRSFQERLTAEIERSKRHKHKLSLMLLDIDHFKSINDTFGHPMGDKVLCQIARTLETQIRSSDVPARYGGEEFAVILPEADLHGAKCIAERIRDAVASLTDVPRPVTVSIGVVEFEIGRDTKDKLIARADIALYEAKHGGRNRVCMAA